MVMAKVLLVAWLRPVAEAVSVYVPILPVISQPANDAVPPVAASVLVLQPRVAPVPGCVAMASVIEFVAPLTVLPDWSSTLTTGCVVQVAALAPPPGWALKASWVAGPAVMEKVLLVAWFSPVAEAVSVYVPALPVILQPAKDAVPPVAANGLVVQAKVPPGLVPRARVIEFVAPVTVLPDWSSTLTAGCVLHVAALAPPPGWVLKASWVAAPGVMEKVLLVAPVSPKAEAVSV